MLVCASLEKSDFSKVYGHMQGNQDAPVCIIDLPLLEIVTVYSIQFIIKPK